MSLREVAIAKVSDIEEGEMKAFTIGDHRILLTRTQGEFRALGATCPHYGAPLEEGILSSSRIVCPWHHTSYNAQTGNLEEPPGLDNLPVYQLKIIGEDVIVVLPDEVPSSRLPDMSRSDTKVDGRVFVIVGAGAAGNAAAQTLREDGFKGRIIMITQEDRLPYDRPQLTKEYLEGQSDDGMLPLRSEEFYKDHDIECMLNAKVNKVAIANRMITFENGDELAYDSILLASGGIPRTLDVPGSELHGVFTLRSWADSSAIIEASKVASNVVVVGTSFIGIESAYSLSQRDLSVTVVGVDSVPFEGALGAEIGSLFQQLHEANGVQFRLKEQIARLEGTERVEAVLLESGERIPADLVVVGVGVRPATDFIEGLDLLSDGSIAVDEFFQATDRVYAAGDIATFPYWYTGEWLRIEHWRTAEQQGRIAGHNMAGNEVPYRSVPFFWTTQVGLYFRYVGHVKRWDEIIVRGDISSKVFTAYYVKGGIVCAAAGNETEKEIAAIEELMRLNRMPLPHQLRAESFNILEWFEKAEDGISEEFIRRPEGFEEPTQPPVH
jgi:NADPH-dependent 2,4-dienoyl-CoA reductase/sulfur reductase-like enzyme/nitrite reductase/ring-hydroxylating ferredoxin subunit